MSRPPQIAPERLAHELRIRGPVSATDLAAQLRVNRTTIVRAFADFGPDLVKLGAGRSTRYALRRNVRHAGSRWPVYQIGEDGRARLWAWLEALHGRQQWRVEWSGSPPDWAERFSGRDGLWDGFPFFLGEVRPQGFLGRAIARNLPRALGLPDDPRTWSDDHTIGFLQAAGEDLPGALVVGDEGLRIALAHGARSDGTVPEADRAIRYPALARAAADSLPGSSAGGEQPKFLTTVAAADGSRRAVLVKFSPPQDQAAGQRWADLLLCEYHAHEVLAAQGLAMPGACVLEAEDRRFLEVPRFDRTGAGGRRSVVSLLALHAAAIGYNAGPWLPAVAELEAAGFLSPETVATVRSLHAFGELIGNTDMHFGNLAFFLTDALPFAPAPAYDMLPMLWAPSPQGEIPGRTFAPAPPLPADESAWHTAAAWAGEFWQRVASDSRLSPDFVRIARTAAEVVRRR